MKRTYKIVKVFIAFLCLTAANLKAQTYCSSQAITTYDEEIYNVMINGAQTNVLYSFTNGCTTPAPGPGPILSEYSNFTSLGSLTNLIVGTVVSFSVAENECDGPTYYSNGCAIWIDYNQNGLFTDPGEQIYIETGTTVSPRNITGTTTIPTSATFGPTRMRVMVVEGSFGAGLTPCLTSYGYGETEDYIVTIIPSTPCSAAPGTNTILPLTFTTCPGYTNPALTLASSYTLGGITYQWLGSTTSPVGPFTAITGATLSSAPVPTLGVTTWYQVVVTCTNTGGNVTLPVSQYYVAGNVVNTVPYFEDFEGIQLANRLPNCSWAATNIGTTVNTYMASASNNRVPRSGSKFAGFSLPCSNQYVYSNGITMSPGITYSAALWYTTEYVGYSNWTDLTIYVGSSQSPTGLVQVAKISPAVSGPYKLLSGVFTVPSAGNYYIAVKANASNGQALYLSWDDLSVTIPCYGLGASNSPTITLSANQTTICTGDQVSLNANGADTYTWSTGANGSSISDTPPVTSTYTVWGSNALTGCTSVLSQLVNVIPSPNVLLFASSATVCSGQPVTITAIGAGSYVWSNGATGGVIVVTPTVGVTYNVIGTDPNGCSNTNSQHISVNPLPNIVPNSSNPGDACKGDLVTLSANGGVNYQWVASSTGMLLQGNPVNITTLPVGVTVFTVTGTNANGCAGKNTIAQSVVICTGITKNASSPSGVRIYPNPTNGEFTVESNSGSVKTLEVIDFTGRVIISKANVNDQTTLNINELANGIYYVRVKSSSGVEIIKVVKQ